jgi:hypothetical protein
MLLAGVFVVMSTPLCMLILFVALEVADGRAVEELSAVPNDTKVVS